MLKGLKFDNQFELAVRAGDTGEVLHEESGHNDISDDFLCGRGKIFINEFRSAGVAPPWCFLLPDGSAWSGFTYDRQNPYAPYTVTTNNVGDSNADCLFKGKNDSGCSLTDPYGAGNLTGKWKLFYRWSLLPINLELRAFGLTGWQSNISNFVFGIVGDPSPQQQTNFVPQTLVVLPSAILVRGRNATTPSPTATQTPDILEITYYLSILGA